MVAQSKVFAEHFSWLTCNELLHQHSCRRLALENLWHFTWSNSKYYLPVVLLQVMKRAMRGNNALLLPFALRYYAEIVFGGVVNGWVISVSICALRNLLGKFGTTSFVFIPSLIGSSLTAFLPMHVKLLQHTTVFQALIETVLMQRGNLLTKYLASSVLWQTLLFMACSSIIMLGKQKRWYNGFWLIAPDKQPLKQVSSSSAVQYVIQGVRKYLLIGFAVDTFKGMVKCARTGNWHLKHLRLESMALLGCYVGIYRATVCYLQRQQNNVSKTLEQWLSGFLGGVSYVFFPKLTILSYALLEAIRTLWTKYIQPMRKQFGYSDLAHPIALAYLIHTYVFQPRRVNALAAIIIDGATANYAKNVSRHMKILQPAIGKY